MRLLIVGHLDGQLSAATKIAMDRGAKVTHTREIPDALAALRSGQGADLLMVDTDLDVGALIRQLTEEHIVIPVVACGIGNDSQAAVAAIRAGAKEYIPLPPDPELIGAVLTAVADDQQQMVTRDETMNAVIALADQVAPSTASILITGESGVGKEVMAKYVHGKSSRADKPLISVNCAAIPENLLESELFGHEKGAFTGAIARRIGKFEEANGGTLLLDEISEMDVRLQAKLLRAIQEREIDRVGGTKPIKVDIRIMATSNRNLLESVQEGAFREDLFYRLNVVNLKIPPLRDRPKDILALSEFFIAKYAQANGLPVKPLSNKAQRFMTAHAWKGNVRELENTLHRAVLLSTGPEITEESIRLPDGTPTEAKPGPQTTAGAGAMAAQTPHGAAPDATAPLVGRTVAEVERDLILDTLDHCLGNRTHAANILGISIRTLRNKLKQYTDDGIPVPMPGEARAAQL